MFVLSVNSEEIISRIYADKKRHLVVLSFRSFIPAELSMYLWTRLAEPLFHLIKIA